jgi:hypothetical protein
LSTTRNQQATIRQATIRATKQAAAKQATKLAVVRPATVELELHALKLQKWHVMLPVA